jgi:hypothetical protein
MRLLNAAHNPAHSFTSAARNTADAKQETLKDFAIVSARWEGVPDGVCNQRPPDDDLKVWRSSKAAPEETKMMKNGEDKKVAQ